MVVSIRMTGSEHELLSSYAHLHSVTISEAVKRAVFERIEDEFDITVGDEAYREYLKDSQTVGHDEAWAEILG